MRWLTVAEKFRSFDCSLHMSFSHLVFAALLGQTALDRNPATVSDSYALEANPAGLAFMTDSEIRLLNNTALNGSGLNFTSLRAATVWPGRITLAGSASWGPGTEKTTRFYSGLGGALGGGPKKLFKKPADKDVSDAKKST